MLDREQRGSCAPSFAKDILDALRSALGDTDGVGVVIVDRMFEAWLMAAHGRFDGHTRPEAELRRRLGRYDKTRDGPKLFAELQFDAVRRNSPSLDKLLRTLGV